MLIKTGEYVQQGDVIIKRVDVDMVDMQKIKKSTKGFILAEGEATGHAHRVADDIELFEKEGTLYINSKGGFTVEHEEHKPITIEKGTYEIGIVQEYDHFAEEARRVAD